ncbi:PE_PGRS family protein [Sorangium cellulosum So ce56]|uniref:PE_PGRS family protein n=1 Tax=Sorangium cellulosum (strain So ce56) TaxID=448385 RepID=A9FDH9_SORC5|nr:PE_PGRS family protein [Sorangium cellulosum So ce56]
MPRIARTPALFALGTMAACLAPAGCFPFSPRDDCEHKAIRCEANLAGAGGAGGVGGGGTGGAAGSGGATGAGGAAGTGGAGGGPTPVECVPSNAEDWTADARCGVFVSATASDGGSGTPDAPVNTLAEAIALAAQIEDESARRVYACAEEFQETLTVTSSVTVFGALDCATHWRWGDEPKTTLIATPGAVPLTMRVVGGTVHLEDLHIIAPSIAPNDAGTSAIAAIADHSKVDLVRCVLQAGDASSGKSGDAPPPPREQAPDGSDGNPACSATTVTTPLPETNDCGTTTDTTDDSRGGRGGNGRDDRGTSGDIGYPDDKNNDNAGGYNNSTATCSAGRKGSDGDLGVAGAGARGVGQLSSTGYAGKPGDDGQRGKAAQGGGGGGGSRGSSECSTITGNGGYGGASGGNGGAGGCGGAGGKGGAPGGSSIALVSLDAKLTLNDVSLIAGKGGQGGNGNAGQIGGAGGNGGVGGVSQTFGPNNFLRDACAGGWGGRGGTGGKGGGGQGGHSLGIAFLGTQDTIPSLDGTVIELGTPGAGGEGSAVAQDGAPGLALPLLDFASPPPAPGP